MVAFVLVIVGALVMASGNIVISKVILFIVMGLFVIIAILALFNRSTKRTGRP